MSSNFASKRSLGILPNWTTSCIRIDRRVPIGGRPAPLDLKIFFNKETEEEEKKRKRNGKRNRKRNREEDE